MKFSINFLDKKNIFLLIVFLFSIFLFNNYIISNAESWTEPTCDPPDCNIPAPLNQGNTPQTKTGGLTIGDDLSVADAFVVQGASSLQDVTIATSKILELSGTAQINVGSPSTGQGFIRANINKGASDALGIYVFHNDAFSADGILVVDGGTATSSRAITGQSTNAFGLVGLSSSLSGASVYGESTHGIGLWGATNDGLAGRFDGEVVFYKSSGSSTTINGAGIIVSDFVGTGNRCLYADQWGVMRVSTGDCGLSNAESYSIPCNPDGVTTSPEKAIKIGESSYIYDSSCGGGPGTTLQIQSDETINIRGTNVPPQLFTVSQGNTNLFTILPDGNVGIGGVTSPQEKLQVNGAVYLGEIAAPSPTTTNRLYNTGGSLFWNGAQLNTAPISWILSGTNLYTTSTVTKIGIGTTTPFSDLHVYNASSGPIITLSGLNTNYRGLTVKDISGAEQWFYGSNNSNNFVVRRSGGTDYFTIASSTGYIGIGTQAPSSKLHVNGSTLITGNLNVQGSLTLATTTINSWEDIIQCPPRRLGIYYVGDPTLDDYLFYNTCVRPNSHSIRLTNVNIIFNGGGGQRIRYTDCQYFCQEYGLPYGVHSNRFACETGQLAGRYDPTGNGGNGRWEQFNCGYDGGTYTTSCDCSNGSL